MKTNEYFKSIVSEMYSLKNRVRDLIDNRHWQTDGELKESILRNVLRQYIPEDTRVGRGFVITDKGQTHQQDILLTDRNLPVLFKEGDLSIVRPETVKGIIEVKTRVTKSTFHETLKRSADDAEKVNFGKNRLEERFCGVFSYDSQINDLEGILDCIKEVTDENYSRIVNFICIGKDKFVKYYRSYRKPTEILSHVWILFDTPGLHSAHEFDNISVINSNYEALL